MKVEYLANNHLKKIRLKPEVNLIKRDFEILILKTKKLQNEIKKRFVSDVI